MEIELILILVIIKMYYLCEAVLVGFYSCFIYFLVSGLKYSFVYLLFLTGFLKHMLGYYIGIHSYYCENGYACKKVRRCGNRSLYSTLLFESVLEGIVFVILGYLFMGVVRDKLCNVFLIGVFLHVVCEICGLHDYFCRERCGKYSQL